MFRQRLPPHPEGAGEARRKASPTVINMSGKTLNPLSRAKLGRKQTYTVSVDMPRLGKVEVLSDVPQDVARTALDNLELFVYSPMDTTIPTNRIHMDEHDPNSPHIHFSEITEEHPTMPLYMQAMQSARFCARQAYPDTVSLQQR